MSSPAASAGSRAPVRSDKVHPVHEQSDVGCQRDPHLSCRKRAEALLPGRSGKLVVLARPEHDRVVGVREQVLVEGDDPPAHQAVDRGELDCPRQHREVAPGRIEVGLNDARPYALDVAAVRGEHPRLQVLRLELAQKRLDQLLAPLEERGAAKGLHGQELRYRRLALRRDLRTADQFAQRLRGLVLDDGEACLDVVDLFTATATSAVIGRPRAGLLLVDLGVQPLPATSCTATFLSSTSQGRWNIRGTMWASSTRV